MRAQNNLEFRLLGPLEVLVGGQPVPLVGAKQRALLALLVLRANEVVSHDRLVDELWPESPPATDHALQMQVSRLRRTLAGAGAGEPIATRPGGYRLAHDPDGVDLWRFESQLGEARALLEEGEPARAVELLRGALALWRGEALVGVPLGPSLSAEAARLDELRLTAVEDRIEAELLLGRHARVVGELEALVLRHPVRERLRRLLMLALYGSGRQADALAAYQDARRTLVEQLGIEPGEQLRELERRILRHDDDLEPRRRRRARGEMPDVRYTRSGDTSIAYATVGEGPFDVVFISGWVFSNFAVAWEGPAAAFYRRMASFCRLILFDKRGTGLSDRDVGLPDFETRMDDVRAVMDEVGSQRAGIMGVSEGGPMAALFAASHPERTAASVLYGTGASWRWAPDYPWAPTAQEKRRVREAIVARWGEPEFFDDMLDWFAPSRRNDEEVKRWWRRWAVSSASPSAAEALWQMNSEIDIRQALPAIRAPTLVLRVADDRDWHPEETRYLAERIPGAELVDLPRRRPRLVLSDRDRLPDGGAVPDRSLGPWRLARGGDAAGARDAPPRRSRRSPRDRATPATGRRRERVRAAACAHAGAAGALPGQSNSTAATAVSSHASTARRAPSAAPARSPSQRTSSASRSAPACTPASASSSTTRWRASPSRSASTSPPRPAPARSSSPRR